MSVRWKMKYLSFIAVILVLSGCDSASKSRADVDEAATTHDPTKLTLEAGGITYGKRAILPNGIETGTITLGDGEQVKYWFKSHHLGNDLGYTRFEFDDGTVNHLEGWFCCEVQLPDPQIADRSELQQFIAVHDGKSP